MRLDCDLNQLVDEVATRVAAEFASRIASEATFPRMAMDEATAHTRVPAGAFRITTAAGHDMVLGGQWKSRPWLTSFALAAGALG